MIIKEINEKKNLVQKEKLYILQYIYQKQVILDENNSAILKQKKRIDKLDNDNKIMDQEKNEILLYIVQEQVYHLVLIHYLF